MESIKVLLIEDNPGDARLIQEMLSSATFELVWANRLSTGLERFAEKKIDLILLDLALPDSQGFDTFTKVHSQSSRTPIILLTGLDDEEVAIKTMKLGAQDYLIKGEVTANLLSRAIRYAIQRRQIEGEKEQLILQLQEALSKVKLLSGFLPICSSCKKIRDDRGYWNQIESYIRDHSEAEFSHGICPECFKKLYPDMDINE